MTNKITTFSTLWVVACTTILLFHPCHSKPAPFTLSPKEINTYQTDGVIIVRGLLQGKDLEDAIKASRRIQRTKSLAQRIAYRLFNSYASLQFQTWRKHPALERVAFESAASTIAAQLMGLDEGVNYDDADATADDTDNACRPVRLLKDAVLGYSAGDGGCGWHVDDKVFWPCEDRNVGKRDAGVNVWITLSPVTAEEGGGLAIAPGTHRMEFAEDCRAAIAERGPQTTCSLETLRPECHQTMESLKMVYDLQPGDAIVHDRYIFHRADKFVDVVEGKKAGTKQRISLRYVTADSTFYNFMDKEVAVEAKQMSTGDFISKGGEFYPQTWPDSLPEERRKKVPGEKPIFTLKRVLAIAWKKISK